jgi:hypothetical protein
MNNFTTNNTTGELWIRTPQGIKDTANNVLSAVYLKYNSYTNFYSELTSNQITRFEIFYDNIFIETPSGCIFEKLLDQNGSFIPYNLSNLFTAKHTAAPGFVAFSTKVDYWFNESRKKIYFCNINVLESNKNFNSQFSMVWRFYRYGLVAKNHWGANSACGKYWSCNSGSNG